MRAHIDERGNLTVEAESALESYALDRWSDDYFGQDSAAQRKSVLMICTTVLAARPSEAKAGEDA